MSLLTPEATALLYLAVAVCFILALKGLSSPRTARRGNLIGAGGAALAVVTVFLSARLQNLPAILITIGLGGWLRSRRTGLITSVLAATGLVIATWGFGGF